MIDAAAAYAKLVQQSALGARVVGTSEHRAAQKLLASWLQHAELYREHTFTAPFWGHDVICRNLWGRFPGNEPGRILLGSHYDTRPWADCDANPARQHEPVPGANDGASGVALLAELAVHLPHHRGRPTVDIVFFDAEDWHDIDGHDVSLGARTFTQDLDSADRPDAVVVVDMVAGHHLMLDVDANCQSHRPSYDLTLQLFQLGQRLGLPAFTFKKPNPYKMIGCDHTPFMEAGIPSALLIDIDYPPWHTMGDVPQACTPTSLQQVGRLLEAFLFNNLSDAGRLY